MCSSDLAKTFIPSERKLLSFILVKLKDPADAPRVAADIRHYTGLAAYTGQEFRSLSMRFFLFKSGIFLNFAISAAIAFAIGGGIAGQTFYNFTLDHLRYFGVLKAMGASNRLLTTIIVLQAVTVALEYGLFDLDRLERLTLRLIAKEYFVLNDDDPEEPDDR